MESEDVLKEIDIKNRIRVIILSDIMTVRDIDFSDIFLDERSCKTCGYILMKLHTKLSWVEKHCVLH